MQTVKFLFTFLLLATFIGRSYGATELKPVVPHALLAYLKVKPGTESQFADAAKTVIAESRKEPGNLVYILQTALNDPQQFVFYELYKSDADLELHKRSKHTVEFLKQVDPILLPGQFTLTKYQLSRNDYIDSRISLKRK